MRPLPAFITQPQLLLRPLPHYICSAEELNEKRLFRSTILLPRLVSTDKIETILR